MRNLTRRLQTGLLVLEELADPRPSYEEFVAEQKAEQRKTRSFRIISRRPARLPQNRTE